MRVATLWNSIVWTQKQEVALSQEAAKDSNQSITIR